MVCEQFRISHIATILVGVRQVWQGPPTGPPPYLPTPQLPEILDLMLLSEASQP